MIEHQPYNDKELVKLYSTMLDIEDLPRWAMQCLFCRTALATGCRVFELRLIQLTHILADYEPPVIFIPSGKGPRRNGGQGRSRYVQVIPEFSSRLRGYLAGRAGKPEEYLFYVENPMRPASKVTLQRWWLKVVRFAGLRVVPIHQGARGTHITHEIERLPIHKLADRAGNSMKTCERYYRQQIVGRDYVMAEPEWRSIAAR
jgi:integrase